MTVSIGVRICDHFSGEIDDNFLAGGQGDLPDLCVICLDEKYNAAFLP